MRSSIAGYSEASGLKGNLAAEMQRRLTSGKAKEDFRNASGLVYNFWAKPAPSLF